MSVANVWLGVTVRPFSFSSIMVPRSEPPTLSVTVKREVRDGSSEATRMGG